MLILIKPTNQMESDKYMYTYIDKVNRIVFDVSRQA